MKINYMEERKKHKKTEILKVFCKEENFKIQLFESKWKKKTKDN